MLRRRGVSGRPRRPRPATSRPGCCPTTAPARTTGCARHAPLRPTTTRSTWSSSAPAPAAGADPAAGPGRLAGGLPGRRAVLGPRPRLGQRRARLAHAVLDRAPADRRQRPGAAGQQQLRPRRRRLDGPLRRLHAALPPVGLPHLPRTASAPTGRSPTRTCGRTTRPSRRSCRSPASTGRGAIRTATRTRRTRWAATARSSCGARGGRHRGPGRPGRHRQRPLRQPSALHLPRLLPPGMQGQRQGQPADHPRARRAGARRGDPARLPRSPGRSSTTRPAGPPASPTSRRPGAAATGPGGRVAGYSIETPRLLLLSADPASPGGWATTTTSWGATSWCRDTRTQAVAIALRESIIA